MTWPYQSRWHGKDGGSEPGMLQQVVWSRVSTNGQELVCLLQEIQRLFHGEWTPAILVTLSDGPKRFKQIRDHVRSLDSRNDPEGRHRVLHDGVLAKTLRAMTDRNLIEREQVPTVFPPSVRYALAPATVEALSAWESVIDWARNHPELIARTRMCSPA